MSQGDLVDEPPPGPRVTIRSTRLAKLLTVFGVVALCAVLSCCALAAIFRFDATEKPAQIEAIAQKFGPLKIPQGFKATIAIFADNMFAGVQIARFKQEQGRGDLIIGSFHLRGAIADEKNDKAFFELMLKNVAPDLKLIDVKDKKERTVHIRGRDAVFEIADGEDRASTTKMKQVTGSFVGPEGTAYLLLQAEADFLSDADIDALLQSMEEKKSSE